MRSMAAAAGPALWLSISVLTWSCSSSSATRDNPGSPSATSAPARVLVVTHTEGFRHSSIPIAENTIAEIGRRSGLFTASFCRDRNDVAGLLTPSGLAGFDALVFANTTGNLGVPDLDALLNWIREGHGFAGMHSASDTY